MWVLKVKTGMMAQFAMRNDVDNINPQRAVAISSDDSIVLSSCGAKISWRQLLKSLPHVNKCFKKKMFLIELEIHYW